MARLEFIVPGKPRSFQRVAQSKSGHWFDPCKREKKVVAEAALEARARAGMGLFTGSVRVFGYFYGMRSNQDLDNVLKLVLDAMNKVVYEDDRQVGVLVSTRCAGKPDRSHIFVEDDIDGEPISDPASTSGRSLFRARPDHSTGPAL